MTTVAQKRPFVRQKMEDLGDLEGLRLLSEYLQDEAPIRYEEEIHGLPDKLVTGPKELLLTLHSRNGLQRRFHASGSRA